jgi:hypothetical protein
VLELVIDGSSEGFTIPRSSAGNEVTAQRDQAGKVCAYTYTVNGQHRVDLPDLASFRFALSGARVNAVPVPDARRDWIVDAYRRIVLPLALQAQGREVLHASAVLARGRVVGVCGKSGTGKSTIAYALSGRGHQLWGDDALALSIGEQEVEALPLPFRIRLKGEAALRFGAQPAADNGLAILEADGPALRPTALGALVVLERGELPSVERSLTLRRLAPNEALPALLAEAFSFSAHDETSHRRMALHYLEVAARVPMFALRAPWGLERLDEMLDSVEQIMQPTVAHADG